jgi:hypothetical protein
LVVFDSQKDFGSRGIGSQGVSHEELAERYQNYQLPAHIDSQRRTPQTFLEDVLKEWLSTGSTTEWMDDHDPAEVLVHYIRAQTLLGVNTLVLAESISYQRSGSTGLPIFEDIPEETLAAIDVAADELRKVFVYLQKIIILKARDDALLIHGEGSGIRDLTRLLEVLYDLASFAFRGYRVKAVVEGKDSDAFLNAIELARRTLHELELSIVVLADISDEEEFGKNGIRSLRQKSALMASAAERLQREILDSAGFPGNYPGEVMTRFNYVPNPSRGISSYWQEARNRVNEAITDWERKETLERQYDMDQTALRSELQYLRNTYIYRMLYLTGVDPADYKDPTGRILGDSNSINLYLQAALDSNSGGEIGIHRIRIEQAEKRLESVAKGVDAFQTRIRIEEQRQGGIANIILENLEELKALDYSISKATAISYSFDDIDPFYEGGSCDEELCVGKWSSWTSTNFNPGAIDAGRLAGQRREIEALQSIAIEGIKSHALIQNLLLDQEIAHLNAEEAAKEVEAASLTLDQLLLELGRLIQDYQQASDDLAEAYFSNPAYRIARDQAITRAQQSLRQAQMQCYRFGRRLEYGWSDVFDNSILPPIEPSWNRFKNVEAIFETINPYQCRDFLNALMEWDVVLRNNRSNHKATPAYHRRLSFRRHILGLDDYDDNHYILPVETLKQNRAAFREYVHSHRLKEPIPGFEFNPDNPALLLSFPLNLLSPLHEVANYFQTMNQWNHKILAFDFNLVGSADLKRGPGETGVLNLLQRGVAAVRTHGDSGVDAIIFDANPWKDPDEPFGRPNAATYQNVTFNVASRDTNFQSLEGDPLVNRAVAATEWTILLDPDAQFDLTLDLAELTDIEILISYWHGAPPAWY